MTEIKTVGGKKRVVVPDVDWRRRLLHTQKGDVACRSFNARLILENHELWQGVLGYCQFSFRIMKRRRPPIRGGVAGEWTDGDSADLRHWLAENEGIEPGKSDLEDAVLGAARSVPFHPVREYLEALQWDGEKRIGLWLMRYLGADDRNDDRRFAYLEAVGRKWLIAAVARAHAERDRPVKADYMLILEGQQRTGKSTALKILGGDWFTDSHFNLGDKDGYQFIRGVWIVEMAELDAFNKAETTRAKQFLSSSTDRYRASYGRHMEEYPRQCVFAGSTNQDAYLKDPTGNTRYFPVRCGESRPIDLAALRADRDQLWAEALVAWRDGESWWPTHAELSNFAEEQDERFSSDAWQDLVEAWLDEPGQRSRTEFLLSEILSGALRLEPHQMKPPEQTRVGMIMMRLGWRKRRITRRVDDKIERPYVYERPPDDGFE